MITLALERVITSSKITLANSSSPTSATIASMTTTTICCLLFTFHEFNALNVKFMKCSKSAQLFDIFYMQADTFMNNSEKMIIFFERSLRVIMRCFV